MSMDVRGGRGVPHLRVRRAPRYRVHRSEEHTSELQSQSNLVCRLLLEKKKIIYSIFVVEPHQNLLVNQSLVSCHRVALNIEHNKIPMPPTLSQTIHA